MPTVTQRAGNGNIFHQRVTDAHFDLGTRPLSRFVLTQKKQIGVRNTPSAETIFNDRKFFRLPA